MVGEGNESLVEAMDYILTQESAEKDLLQYTEKDKIAVVPFSSYVMGTWYAINGKDTENLKRDIKNLEVNGATNIYDASIQALKILSTIDMNEYNLSVVLMTDGQSNRGDYSDLKRYYSNLGKEIPIYSITFGDAYEGELKDIANLTNGKVFDGKTDLLKAFKEVRGYN